MSTASERELVASLDPVSSELSSTSNIEGSATYADSIGVPVDELINSMVVGFMGAILEPVQGITSVLGTDPDYIRACFQGACDDASPAMMESAALTAEFLINLYALELQHRRRIEADIKQDLDDELSSILKGDADG
jgi:hypothetical protein